MKARAAVLVSGFALFSLIPGSEAATPNTTKKSRATPGLASESVRPSQIFQELMGSRPTEEGGEGEEGDDRPPFDQCTHFGGKWKPVACQKNGQAAKAGDEIVEILHPNCGLITLAGKDFLIGAMETQVTSADAMNLSLIYDVNWANGEKSELKVHLTGRLKLNIAGMGVNRLVDKVSTYSLLDGKLSRTTVMPGETTVCTFENQASAQ